MQISFSPQRRDDELTVVKSGEVLTINDKDFDLSTVAEGDKVQVEGCEWIVGFVERTNGELRLTLILPHGPNPSEAAAFPAPVVMVADGPLGLPS